MLAVRRDRIPIDETFKWPTPVRMDVVTMTDSVFDGIDGVDVLDTTAEDINEMLDGDVSLEEDATHVHFRTDDTHLIEIGESVGNPILVEADHFLAMDIDAEREMTPKEAIGRQQRGEDVPEDGMVHVDEASIVVSNEDGLPGGGVITVDEGSLADAVAKFEDEVL